MYFNIQIMTYNEYDALGSTYHTKLITPITDRDQIIPDSLWNPHYTNSRFTRNTTGALTIFVDPEVTLISNEFVDEIGENLHYVYSDRLAQWLSHDTYQEIIKKAAEEVGNNRSAKFAELMLRYALEDDSIWLGHICAGVNRYNGYSYRIFGYRSDK